MSTFAIVFTKNCECIEIKQLSTYFDVTEQKCLALLEDLKSRQLLAFRIEDGYAICEKSETQLEHRVGVLEDRISTLHEISEKCEEVSLGEKVDVKKVKKTVK